LSGQEQAICRRIAVKEKIDQDSSYIVRKLMAEGVLAGDSDCPCLFSLTFEMFMRNTDANGASITIATTLARTKGGSETADNCADGHTPKALATSMASLSPHSGVISVYEVKPAWPSPDASQIVRIRTTFTSVHRSGT
jgi:hypothetical protein